MNDTFEVRLAAITQAAQDILSFEFRPLDPQGELPPFTAGAHIDVYLANGVTRSYSLYNDQSQRDRYLIAVHKAPHSRGGSNFMHAMLQVGDVIRIGAPRNHFPVHEEAAHSVFIAGGVGITPMWCMLQRLQALGRPWELHYASRTRAGAALLTEIESLDEAVRARVHVTFDQEPGNDKLDLAAIAAAAPADAHLYCCGPVPMLQAFEAATAGRPGETVHLEYFTAKEAAATAGGFSVRLAKSGAVYAIPSGRTILETLMDAGVDAPHLCMEGTCGLCEVKVLEGVPDHRDTYLTNEDKAANKTMMICCSGSATAELVIEL